MFLEHEGLLLFKDLLIGLISWSFSPKRATLIPVFRSTLFMLGSNLGI